MRIKPFLPALVMSVAALVAACSILKKDDPEAQVQKFLGAFQASLKQPEAEILKQFETQQSPQAILTAISVLRNTDSTLMNCIARFSESQIIIDEGGIRVIFPITLASKTLNEPAIRESSILMWLKQNGESFLITQFDAEEFYSTYVSLKYEVEHAAHKQQELAERREIITRAQSLEEQYDSVIWYAKNPDATYFYVAAGNWDVERFQSKGAGIPTSATKMGLTDYDGKVLLAPKYDLIGTPGTMYSDVVELMDNGKVGCYHLRLNKVIDPAFDMLVPSDDDGVFFIVKSDTTYGYINDSFEYVAGLPEGAQKYIDHYGFFPDNYTFSASNNVVCEIPNEDYLGSGVIVPPSFWIKSKLFEPVISGIVIEGMAFRAYREYIETKKSFFADVTENISAIVTTIKERYLEGREEFYIQNQLMFVSGRDTLSISNNLWGTGDFEFKRIGNLIELKTYVDQDPSYLDYDDGAPEQDLDIPRYRYYEIGENLTLQELATKRAYAHTEFVKLDSTYITGDFEHYSPDNGEVESISFLSDVTLREMRNEILASYNYVFNDQDLRDMYISNGSSYKPENNLAQVMELVNDIDRHNLAFLEKIIGPVEDPSASM